ncbi:ATP-binding protein, partial [Streptomyces griseus]
RALAEDDPARAAHLAARNRVHAERFGTPTAMGEALRCVALFAPPERSAQLLAEAVAHLEKSPSAYEHALARVDYGIAIGSHRELARAQKQAMACGAEGLAARAQQARASIRSSE